MATMLTCQNCPSSWTCYTNPITLPPRTTIFNIHDAPRNVVCQVAKHVRDHGLATFQSSWFNSRPGGPPTSLSTSRLSSRSSWDWRLTNVVFPCPHEMDNLGLRQELVSHPFLICNMDCCFLLKDFCVDLPDGHYETALLHELSFLLVSGDKRSMMQRVDY